MELAKETGEVFRVKKPSERIDEIYYEKTIGVIMDSDSYARKYVDSIVQYLDEQHEQSLPTNTEKI